MNNSQEAPASSSAGKYALKIEDGTTWPNPHTVGELGNGLRYGDLRELTRGQCLSLASVVDAYCALALRADMKHKPVLIRRALLENAWKGNGDE